MMVKNHYDSMVIHLKKVFQKKENLKILYNFRGGFLELKDNTIGLPSKTLHLHWLLHTQKHMVLIELPFETMRIFIV